MKQRHYASIMISALLLMQNPAYAAVLNLSDTPLVVGRSQPPLTMLVMGKDHRLYYEAYNDASDLNGDGELDVRFSPNLEYFGYFDSSKCYQYASGVFIPSQSTTDISFAGETHRFTCPIGSNTWSGNFLNYVTTSRMDALRKVLYGGKRFIDTSTRTVLERAFIPQDAHSWGKEYTSITTDGYDISYYTPLSQPTIGQRHLFANVTLLNGDQSPLMRVMSNVQWRVWEWISKERPVAGNSCQRGTTISNCIPATPNNWHLIPAEVFTPGTLSVSYYDIDNGDPFPTNHSSYDNLIGLRAVASRLCGTQTPTQTHGSESTHPFLGVVTPMATTCQNNYYMTIYEGTLRFPSSTTIEFTLDGDDAVEVVVDGNPVVGWYGGHSAQGGPNLTYRGSFTFLANTNYEIELRHMDRTGGSSHAFYWNYGNAPALTDYTVRVEVCNQAMLESNCQQYGLDQTIFKPVGLLHEYGESDRIKFGLISGSFRNNTQGGVLRKNISSFASEVDFETGIFSSVSGIVHTIDAMQIVAFGGNYTYTCANVFTQPISNGDCPNWGNPIGEMMYEAMRYFTGAQEPTQAYDYTGSPYDVGLGLPKPVWEDPYDANLHCSKPVQLVLSDANPNYDSDQLPGSVFSAFTGNRPVVGFNAAREADEVYAMEYGGARHFYIGESNGIADFVPTPKAVTNFSSLRGLSPEDPSKFGGFYSPGIAWYGKNNDLHAASGEQSMETFAVAMASPLPTFSIPVNGRTITLVPFAKSVGGGGINNPNAQWTPTNQIVDFYVEEMNPTSGRFRINFEDVEHGNDHDMDAIAEYAYNVIGDEVEIVVNSVYAAGSIRQHMGYVVSGTNGQDGTYLVIRDLDTTGADDATSDYFLDTPPGVGPNLGGPSNNTGWDDNTALPLTSTRRFRPGNVPAAETLKSPLWYTAKYGGFTDEDEDGTPANSTLGNTEWDEDGDGNPDNYFLVTNALGLGDQLSRAFERILNRTGSASALSVNAGSLRTETVIYQARFDPMEWTGELRAIRLSANGRPEDNPAWDAGEILSSQSLSSRQIFSYNPVANRGIAFRWPANSAAPSTNEFSVAQLLELVGHYTGADVDEYGRDLVAWIRGFSSLSVGRPFRERERLLGDIINSDPLFVGYPRRGYPDNWSDNGPENSNPYSTFAASQQNRLPMVYVGANDGMLHGFEASIGEPGSGEERLAYVPSMVFANLHELASPLYNAERHRFFVDGPAKVDDVFFDNEWHTVLIGTLGKGGQGVYALDITDPNDFDETNANNVVLWEFSDQVDADLGFSYGNVSIGRFYNQEWLVAVGNGHNNTHNDGAASASGDASIFLLDVRNGTVLRKFETQVGMAQDPTGQNRNNGMVSPALIDSDGDFIIDTIYAGDLFGNVWKIDVTDADFNQWDFAFRSGGTPAPLFVARDADHNPQPITAPIEVGRHPDDNTQVMVYFGTGKFLEAADNSPVNQQTQSIYALIDNNQSDGQINGRSDLLEQRFIFESEVTPLGASDPVQVRLSTDNRIDYAQQRGWFIDLVDANNPTDNRGERVIRKMTIRSGRLIATTLQPDEDPCNPGGGAGWLLTLNAFNGSRLNQTPIDLNGDGLYNQNDYIRLPDGTLAPISGINDGLGAPSSPVIINRGDDEVFILGTSSGATSVFDANQANQASGRQSWRRIR